MKQQRFRQLIQEANAGLRSIWSTEPREQGSLGQGSFEKIFSLLLVCIWLGIIAWLSFADQTSFTVFSATIVIFLGLGFIAQRVNRNRHQCIDYYVSTATQQGAAPDRLQPTLVPRFGFRRRVSLVDPQQA